jgi:hypothetical protein
LLKNDQINVFVDLIKYIKIPESFCRASILARIQRQLFFSQCHFVGFSSPSPFSFILFRIGSNLFHIIFAIFIYFPIFLSTMYWQSFCKWIFFRFQYIPVTKMVPKQKWRSGEECYFDTDLPGNNRSRNLDKAEKSEKIQKDPKGTNSITILCYCSFQYNHKIRVYLQTYTNLQNGRLYAADLTMF